MGFPQFTRFAYVMKNTIGSLFSGKQHHKDASGVSPFQAVATAMAGTIGTLIKKQLCDTDKGNH